MSSAAFWPAVFAIFAAGTIRRVAFVMSPRYRRRIWRELDRDVQRRPLPLMPVLNRAGRRLPDAPMFSLHVVERDGAAIVQILQANMVIAETRLEQPTEAELAELCVQLEGTLTELEVREAEWRAVEQYQLEQRDQARRVVQAVVNAREGF